MIKIEFTNDEQLEFVRNPTGYPQNIRDKIALAIINNANFKTQNCLIENINHYSEAVRDAVALSVITNKDEIATNLLVKDITLFSKNMRVSIANFICDTENKQAKILLAKNLKYLPKEHADQITLKFLDCDDEDIHAEIIKGQNFNYSDKDIHQTDPVWRVVYEKLIKSTSFKVQNELIGKIAYISEPLRTKFCLSLAAGDNIAGQEKLIERFRQSDLSEPTQSLIAQIIVQSGNADLQISVLIWVCKKYTDCFGWRISEDTDKQIGCMLAQSTAQQKSRPVDVRWEVANLLQCFYEPNQTIIGKILLNSNDEFVCRRLQANKNIASHIRQAIGIDPVVIVDPIIPIKQPNVRLAKAVVNESGRRGRPPGSKNKPKDIVTP